MPKPSQVFISHSNLDREFVEREIISLLQRHGLKVWYSTADIQTASQWQHSIQDGLEQSDWFLVVLSPRSVSSRWVGAEVHWAMDERLDRFVPVLLEECKWQGLHLMIRTIQYVDFRRNLDEARRRILKTWGIDFDSTRIGNQEDLPNPAVGESVWPRKTKRRKPQARPLVAQEDSPTPAVGKPVRPREAVVVSPQTPPLENTKPAVKPHETITNSIGMKLTLIPAGEFLMGSPDSDRLASDNEKPQHHVKITQPFFLGVHPVTQAEYEKVTRNNPSNFTGKGRYPVEKVWWCNAVAFCNKLSELEKVQPFYGISGEDVSIAGGGGYRLPTEAEWEYACRAGTTTRWSCGDDESQLEEHAWFAANSKGSTHAVGEKKPNPWGLYGMHGNVWEWCWDWYWYGGDYYKKSPPNDPMGPTYGQVRVLRGGSFDSRASFVRSAFRLTYLPSALFILSCGFRVARTLRPVP